MKIILTSVALSSSLVAAFAQGNLTPPGAPAPTMKTLAQIEPRTPIATAPFTITAGGSYYLTTNVSVVTGDAITIATNNVTLDLNGFTISSTRSAVARAKTTAAMVSSSPIAAPFPPTTATATVVPVFTRSAAAIESKG